MKDALTDLQLAVMAALWKLGEGTVADVVGAMAASGRTLAPTTVATLLQRLAKDGCVTHRRLGRQFVYRAKIQERDAARGALARVVQSFFGGRVSAAAAQLLESEDLTREDVETMRKLLQRKKG